MAVQYYATEYRSDETEAIKRVTPGHLYLPFSRFRNISLKQWFKKLGYTPRVLVGAEGVSLDTYLNWIRSNEPDEYLALDGEYGYYKMMRKLGLSPIPVVHSYYDTQVETYVAEGARRIAIKDGTAKWVETTCVTYPDVEFHLLGFLKGCPHLTSHNNTVWATNARAGKPDYVKGMGRERNILRMVENLRWEEEKGI